MEIKAFFMQNLGTKVSFIFFIGVFLLLWDLGKLKSTGRTVNKLPGWMALVGRIEIIRYTKYSRPGWQRQTKESGG